jgi:dienelactone hydrolase
MKKIIAGLITLSCVAFANTVTYKVDGKEYQSYYTSPSKNAPLIFMIHDWDGITAYEKKRAQMLADLGYATFAVDMYGKGVKPTTVKEKKALSGGLYKDRVKMRTLLDAGFEQAKKLGLNVANASSVGYCFGGAVGLEFARMGADLKNHIAFHGGLKTPKGQDYTKTQGNVVIFHGTADKVVPMSQFADLADELEKTKISHEMLVYSGAPHAFSVIGSKRYHKVADTKSWDRFVEILNDTMK